jgi:hypothetical protein
VRTIFVEGGAQNRERVAVLVTRVKPNAMVHGGSGDAHAFVKADPVVAEARGPVDEGADSV